MTSVATFLNNIFWMQMIYEVRSTAFETIWAIILFPDKSEYPEDKNIATLFYYH